MTAYEGAKTIICKQPTSVLIAIWEKTTTMEDECVPMVRGWIMDEIESRYPKAYSAWLNTECCRDEELKDYIRRIDA